MENRVYLHRQGEKVVATGPCRMDGELAAVDMGAGYVHAHVVIDVGEIVGGAGGVVYRLRLQGSADEGFDDSYEDLMIVGVGSDEVGGGVHVGADVGRHGNPG